MSARPGPGIFAWFGAAALVCFVGLGLALHHVVAGVLEDSAIAHDGEAVTRLATLLADEAPAAAPLGARGAATVTAFRRLDHHAEHLTVRVWDRRGRLVLGPAADVDRSAETEEARRGALAGRSAGHRHERPGHRPVVHYLVPIARHGEAPVGVLEVTELARELDAQIAASNRRITWIVAGGLGALFLALLPLLVVVVRRLRAHADVLAEQALTDELTGLPNRRALHARLAAHEGPASLVVVDLDDFQSINAVAGSVRGDELLVSAAQRLVTAAGDAYVARLGGDELAVLVPGPDREHGAAVAERACAALAAPSGDPISATAGVAFDASGGSELLARAGAALVAAKSEGVRVRSYAPGHELALQTVQLQQGEIRRLLADPEAVDIAFQPVISLATGDVLFHEALARFSSEPRRTPDVWFAQAHRVGLGVDLEVLAARTALAARDARDIGPISINASPSAIASPRLLDALPEDLGDVTIELTEHELADVEALTRPIEELRRRGARIAIDDAGAGYAGLGQVMRVSPDIIKLDRHLVTALDTTPAKAALIEALVRFARRSDTMICAEGIETMEELRALADLDVELGQGYGIARPAPRPTVAPEAVQTCRDALADALRATPTSAWGTHELERLERVAAALTEARGLDDIPVAAAGLADALHADAIALSVYDRADDAVVELPVQRAGGSAPRYRLDDFPATRHALLSGESLQVLASDPTADPGELAALDALGWQSVLLVPIASRGRPLGILEAYVSADRPWTRTEIQRARLACHQLGAAIEAVRGAGSDVRDIA